MKLSRHFVASLQQQTEPIVPGKLYKCTNCFRPNLKLEHVAIISRGEPYCTVCIGESK